MTERTSSARYPIAIFLGSSLLFLIEPIAGKRILPLLGGSAAVWTACLVFFQLALLLGYFAAHWLNTRVPARAQAGVYVVLLVASLIQLMIAIRLRLHADSSHPITSVLLLLTLLIGLPFVTLSASGPLLQAWCARTTSHPQPYRLYIVSNVGSLLALLVYPWLIEPRATIREQAILLAIGLALLLAVGVLIAMPVGRSGIGAADAPSAGNARPMSAWLRTLWVMLALCGSLLLSAITNHISQNVATFPLLWIVPLVLYLLSFVIAFSDERWHPRPVVLGLAVIGLAVAGHQLYQGDLGVSVPRLIATYCGALFVLCVFCHSELYRRRPAPAHLTAFYFYLAAGGALGAILVGVVAPMTLSGNYELVIGLTLAAVLGVAVTWESGWVPRGFWTGVALILSWLGHRQVTDDRRNTFERERNFYGTLHVTQIYDPFYVASVRTLYHGPIEHGQQVFRKDLAETPTTYYGRGSGVGLAVGLCCQNRPHRIGVIGLGTGTMAAYGRPGDVIRFYDINPAVEGIAKRDFTYVRNSGAKVDVVIGDARVSLAAEPPQNFDVLAVDAFSGDAIPVHLITAEALDVYRRHLAPGGVVAFHISNRYIDLAPVVQQLADHAGIKAVQISSDDDTQLDVFSSDWVLVTNNTDLVTVLEKHKDHEKITIPSRLRLWTDDYNSLLPVLRLKNKGE